MLPAWHEELVARLGFPLGWKRGASDPIRWKERALAAFANGVIEPIDYIPDSPVYLASETRKGYTVHRVRFAPGQGRTTRALLAIPEGTGPFPAALLLHDHGAYFLAGKEKMIRPLAGDQRETASAEWQLKGYEGQSLGDDLARSGWVVLAADALGWGERDCGGYERQQGIACNLLNLGSSWAGVIASEDCSAAALLSSLPSVDPGRIVSFGYSMGGFRSWQVAALSRNISASVSLCNFGTIASLMSPGGNRARGQSAFATTHPGLSRYLDIPDMAATAAPKPLLMIHGLDDRLFPVAGVETACNTVREVYCAFGYPERFRSIVRPGGHVYSRADQKSALGFLAEFGFAPRTSLS